MKKVVNIDKLQKVIIDNPCYHCIAGAYDGEFSCSYCDWGTQPWHGKDKLKYIELLNYPAPMIDDVMKKLNENMEEED